MLSLEDRVLDPSGDVLSQLKITGEEANEDSPTEEPAIEEPAIEEWLPAEEPSSEEVAIEEWLPVEEPLADEAPAEELATEVAVANLMVPTMNADTGEKIEIQVSSRHLALASRVFRRMFDGNSPGSLNPERRPLTPVPLLDDNADALLVLLRIVHGFTRKVPRRLDKPTFL